MHVTFASHPCQLYILDGPVLRFEFSNIQLPDSGANEPGSHGMVAFEISPKPNLANGTQLTNGAAIYFDWHPPVITNSTLNTIDIALGIQPPEPAATAIWPNPTGGVVSYRSPAPLVRIEAWSVLGARVIEMRQPEQESSINFSILPSGIYIVKLYPAGGEVIVRKVVRE
jgi:hypothetical protein